jgi:hypothetical protein
MESGIELLIKFNADITLKNGKKQTPSQMTKDKMVLSKFNAFVKDKGVFLGSKSAARWDSRGACLTIVFGSLSCGKI